MAKSPIRIDKVTLHVEPDDDPDISRLKALAEKEMEGRQAHKVAKRLEEFRAGFMVYLYISAQVSYVVPGSGGKRRSETFQSDGSTSSKDR